MKSRPWDTTVRVGDWIRPRVLELTFSSWDLNAFAHDLGWDGPPFRWDPERRACLRAELDAAFFHLYLLSRDDTDYILDTFPVLRKYDEKKYDEYRTKRFILERYDAISNAIASSIQYKTILDPPPGHPSLSLGVAHA